MPNITKSFNDTDESKKHFDNLCTNYAVPILTLKLKVTFRSIHFTTYILQMINCFNRSIKTILNIYLGLKTYCCFQVRISFARLIIQKKQILNIASLIYPACF